MFKFLKEKLKSAISKISEGVEKEGKVEETVVEKPAEIKETKTEVSKPGEKGFFAKLKEKIVGKEEKPSAEEENPATEEKEEIGFQPEVKEKEHIIEHKKEEKIKISEKEKYTGTIKIDENKRTHDDKKETKTHVPVKEEIKKRELKELPKKEVHTVTEIPEKSEPPEPEKKGFFAKLTEKIITTKIDESQFEKLFWDLELAMMENNVAVEVIDKIKNDLKNELVEKPIRRNKVEETVILSLKSSIEELFLNDEINMVNEIKNKKEKPYVIAFFGINGSGKTTSIAKLANMLKENGISVVLAAGDTFRAASIEQLQLHADKIGIKIIKHDYGSDPAAVAFDAIKHAKAKNIDAVLIDTAGRMHSNENLIQEMKKIIRIAKPDLKIFVGESITGNDCVEQAKTFNESVGIDGIILAKADIDEKGGAAISVSYVTKKPILYLGTGQEYGDLERFDKEKVMKGIGLG